jgi:hypothetical protein
MIEELQRQLERLRIENRKLRSAYDRLVKPMAGVAACATRCGCCEMLRDIAQKAIDDVEVITGESHKLRS